MKRLDLVIGPNGAGKSTFIAVTLAPLLARSVIVNADEIARQRWPDDPATHAYDAARVAAATRSTLIARGRSFIAEHPSKLELLTEAQGAGYIVAVHAVLVPEDLAVQRVAYRVRVGGHRVPETKIRQRYRRLWSLVATALARGDISTVYDNSRLAGPRVVAQLAGGEVIGSPSWPAWAPETLTARWL
jgi:predicted ABC-type ATPase